LLLRELAVDMGEGNAVKCKIPRGVPGILPLVRHRDDIRVIEMLPFPIAAVASLRGRRRLRWIPFQPFWNIEVEELLAPDHSSERLPLDCTGIRALDSGLHRLIELIGLRAARLQSCRELSKRRCCRAPGESQLNLQMSAGRYLGFIPDSRFRAVLLGV